MSNESARESLVRVHRLRRFRDVGCLVVLVAFIASMVVPHAQQARRDAQKRTARVLLGKLHAAQVHHKRQHGSFARLDALRAAGQSPVGEGDAREGYVYSSTATADDYAIVARPEWPGNPSYTMDAMGRLNNPAARGPKPPSPEERIAAARAQAKARPTDVKAWLELARVLFQERRLADALDAARRASRLDRKAAAPSLRGVLVERGDELCKGGKAREALPLIQEALALDPANPEIHALVGDAHRLSGRPGPAEKAYRKALSLRVACVRAWYGLGKIHQARGETPEARHAYLRVISISDDAQVPPEWQQDAMASLEKLHGGTESGGSPRR